MTAHVAEFERHRGRLTGLAYRMLGSAQEAEDVVQDAYVRWHHADPAAIESPAAWLAKVVTNLCLNRLTSARVQREQYSGPWLPEPVLTRNGALLPDDAAVSRDSVSMAMLVLLERLTPRERAVFVLREAFGYPYAEIAEILSVSQAACRKLHSRALHRVGEAPRRYRPAPEAKRRLVERFLAAARDGDVGALERMLAADVTAWGDGGGQAPAARRPVVGTEKVCRLVIGFYRKYVPGMRVEITEVNGETAVLGWYGDRLAGVMVVELTGDRVTTLRTVANPDKLGYLSRQVTHATSQAAEPPGSS